MRTISQMLRSFPIVRQTASTKEHGNRALGLARQPNAPV